MLAPLRERTKQNRVSKNATLIAPTKGWYVYDNLASMPEGTAFLLENVFPAPDYVRLRGGCTAYATGMGSSTTVASLLTYVSGSSSKLFACAGGNIYDVTSGGAVGAAAVTGLNSDYWDAVNMTTSGGSFLFCLNGADDGRLYDGSSWTTTAVTGVSENVCKAPYVYKNRIYFVQNNTMNVWYLPVDSIGGAATQFSLGGVFQRGGYVVAIGSWSVEHSNTGYDDHVVFVSSEGEAAVYSGSYPGDASWTLAGLFRIGKPIGGSRCVQKFGGDLGILTDRGIVPMSKAVTLDEAALSNAAITQPIDPEFRRVVFDRRSMSGWQMCQYPAKQMFILNIPKVTGQAPIQFAANMISGAWCRFTGWDAACFTTLDSLLFYGTKDGRVMQADTGAIDDTAPYTGTIFWSFSDMGAQTMRKSMRMARINVQSSFVPTGRFTMRKDFDFSIPSGPTSSAAPPDGALWDSAVWDSASWPSVVTTPYAKWQTVSGFGATIAPVWQVTVGDTDDIDLRVTSLDLLYEIGEVLG